MAGTDLCPVDEAVKKTNRKGCLPRAYDLILGGVEEKYKIKQDEHAKYNMS